MIFSRCLRLPQRMGAVVDVVIKYEPKFYQIVLVFIGWLAGLVCVVRPHFQSRWKIIELAKNWPNWYDRFHDKKNSFDFEPISTESIQTSAEKCEEDFPFIATHGICRTIRIEYTFFAGTRFHSASAHFYHRLIFNVNKIKIIKTDSLFCHYAAVTSLARRQCVCHYDAQNHRTSKKKKTYRFRHAVAARLSHEWWIQLHWNRIHWMSSIYMNESIVCAQTWFWLAKCIYLFRSPDILFGIASEWKYMWTTEARATCHLMTLNYIQIDWL